MKRAVLVIASAIVFAGCSSNDNLISSAKSSSLNGSPEIEISDTIDVTLDKGEQARLDFTKSGLEANQFYKVSVTLSNGSCSNMSICGTDEDLNRESVCVQGTEQSDEFYRVLKSSDSGSCNFSILLSSDDSTQYQAEIESVELTPVDDCDEYCIFTSTDESMRIVMLSIDVTNSGCEEQRIIEWLDDLSQMRSVLEEFSKNGLPHIDICATESFEHYGLSGEPIYICREYVEDDLRQLKDGDSADSTQREILWGYVHEMAHLADGFADGEIAARVFDSELSAQLECAYAIMSSDFRYSGGLTACEYFENEISLSNGVYSDEAFVHRLLEIISDDKKSIQALKTSLLSDKYLSDMTELEKLDIFLDELSACIGKDIRSQLTKRELDAIYAKFDS